MEQKPPRPPPPSYSQSVHGESSCSYTPAPTDSTPAATSERGPVVRGPDIAYLKSPAGIARIIEAVSEAYHLII